MDEFNTTLETTDIDLDPIEKVPESQTEPVQYFQYRNGDEKYAYTAPARATSIINFYSAEPQPYSNRQIREYCIQELYCFLQNNPNASDLKQRAYWGFLLQGFAED